MHDSVRHKLLLSSEQIQIEELLALAREDLACYAVAVWPRFSLAKHHDQVISKIEALERGELSRLMICLPPRHGKSLLASMLFPSWYLGRHPDRHIIFATYGQELSDDFGRQVRNLVAAPLHHDIFPECIMSEDSTAVRCFSTSQGGGYFAVGRGGPLTGRGADVLIVDDLIKDYQEASSETARCALWEWFISVAYTRLQPRGAVLLVTTRWHRDDLAGRLLASSGGKDWEVLSLPAIAEQNETFRMKGEALWPEKWPLTLLKGIHQQIGSRMFDCLYQQNPAVAEGLIFKLKWWNTRPSLLGVPLVKSVQSWDTAFKKGAENDFSVCTTWGVSENAYFLLHLCREKVEFPELKKLMISEAEQWNPDAILIEDRASGQSLIQELKSSTRLPIVPVKPDCDKLSRTQAITPIVEAGKVFLLEGAPYLHDFLEEMSSFPNGAHDDIVDSTSQALNYLRESEPWFDGTLARLMCAVPDHEELDEEELLEKAMRGIPLSPEEIARISGGIRRKSLK